MDIRLVQKLLSKGEVTQAQALLNSSSSQDWTKPYAAGLIAGKQNLWQEAASAFNEVLLELPENTLVLGQLAVAQSHLGLFDESLASLELALAHDDADDASLQKQYVKVLMKLNRFKQARSLLRTLIKQSKKDAGLFSLYGDLFRKTGRWRQAIRIYRIALQLDKSNVVAMQNLAGCLIKVGQHEWASKVAKRVEELQPGFTPNKLLLGQLAMQSEDLDQAMHYYADAFEENPEDSDLINAIADTWFAKNEFEEAAAWYQRVLVIDEDNSHAVGGLADIINDSEGAEKAQAFLCEIFTEVLDADVDIMLRFADYAWDLGNPETAIEYLLAAKEKEPQRANIYAKVGTILTSKGDAAEGVEYFEKALKQNPNCIGAINGIAANTKGKMADETVKTIHELFDSARLSSTRSSLANALGYYYTAQKDFEKAAHYIKEGNDAQWQYRSHRDWNYTTDSFDKHLEQTKRHYTSRHFDEVFAKPRINTEVTPVFIVGMPRSGTTLSEQILGRHSKILGVGEQSYASQALGYLHKISGSRKNRYELAVSAKETHIQETREYYLSLLRDKAEQLGKPDATHIVDKMPDNYSQIGWILTLFPNAKIINLKRDLRDVALSCWQTQFGSISWASQVEHLSHRVKNYRQFVDHWESVLGDKIFEFYYEDLIADQEKLSKALVSYLDLDWESECLEFYEADSVVRTASISQVRQPIYKTSVQKWKAFEPYLKELFDPITEVNHSRYS